MRKGTDLNEPAQWLAQFIANCDEDTTHGCDPDKIAIFDLVRVCAARSQRSVLTPTPTHGLRSTTTIVRPTAGKATTRSWTR